MYIISTATRPRCGMIALKNGMVFKRGGVMMPAALFHGGQVNGYNVR